MSRDDLIRFARRDWAAVAQAKERHWLRRKQQASPSELLRRSDDLLRHSRSSGGRSRSIDDRLEDARTHHRVGLALRAVAHPSR